MSNSRYYIMGIIGTLLAFYFAVLVIGIDTQEGLLMLNSGCFSLLGIITLSGFKKAKRLSAAFFLISAISNLVINNSITTALLPGILGFMLILDRKSNV